MCVYTYIYIYIYIYIHTHIYRSARAARRDGEVGARGAARRGRCVGVDAGCGEHVHRKMVGALLMALGVSWGSGNLPLKNPCMHVRMPPFKHVGIQVHYML